MTRSTPPTAATDGWCSSRRPPASASRRCSRPRASGPRERGFEVLAARGRELEREFPFGVARQLFEARVRAARAAERRRLLQGSAGLAAELLGLEPPAPPRGRTRARRTRSCTACTGSPRTSPSARRSLLVVDDAHWADELSLRFVAYLAARLEDLPIALVVARRAGPARRRRGRSSAQLAAEPAARVAAPGPLSEAAAAPARRGARAGRRAARSPPPATTRPAATRSCSPSS